MKVWKNLSIAGGVITVFIVFGFAVAKDAMQALMTALCAIGTANFSVLAYIAHLLSHGKGST